METRDTGERMEQIQGMIEMRQRRKRGGETTSEDVERNGVARVRERGRRRGMKVKSGATTSY